MTTKTETFRSPNPPSPTLTRAAERYLEQYGDPMVMNTYLKIAVLALIIVCLMLGALIFRSQRALASIHPFVVRIDSVGHAEAVDFHDFSYRPQEVENKYYLSRWTELYFGRNRYTIQRDFTNSLYFLNGALQRAVIDDYRNNKTIDNFVRDSTLPYTDIEVKNVILDNLQQSPYSARIEFLKLYTNPNDHAEIKRERWTSSVTYVFRNAVQNGEVQVNPLGLTIIKFRSDQAFE